MSNEMFAANQKYNLISHGDTILIALSGGADSVCLTHKLWSLRESLSLQLLAAHVNHGIRGQEAARDEAFCRAFCAALEIPLEVLHADVPAQAAKNKESLEACGRRVRYAFFQSLATEKTKIATAHHADDHTETVLMHMVRGTGGRGLCGIAPKRGNIIRPLLLNSREQIEQYCQVHRLDFVTDSTNSQEEYTRNKIRHTIMPVLRTLNPSVAEAFLRMAEHAAQDEAVLDVCAQDAYTRLFGQGNTAAQAALSNLQPGIQRRVIRLALQRLSEKEVDAVHIEDVCRALQTGKRITTSGGVTVCSRGGQLHFMKAHAPLEPFSQTLTRQALFKGGTVVYPHGVLKVQTIAQKDLQNLNKELLDNAVDCAKINNTLQLRSRCAGDVFRSARGYSKSLKKLLNETHIPPESRNGIPVLADGAHIVWVGGFGTCAPYRADESTERIMIINNRTGDNEYEGGF